MSLMSIGEFAERTRLSPKALRLYDHLGLVVPAEVDASSGYRLYSPSQVESARLVGLLRRLDMPLATIAAVLAAGPGAAAAIGHYWEGVEAQVAERRALASYLQARLRGEQATMYHIDIHHQPERQVLSINRHVTIEETDAFFDDAFSRLKGAGPGLEGIAGVPFLVFYGEVSEDSDGPMELCRPVAASVPAGDGAQLRLEPAHEEAYIRLPASQLSWPEMLPACDALAHWAGEHQRQAAGPLRQLFIADRRLAGADELVCDLALPLR